MMWKIIYSLANSEAINQLHLKWSEIHTESLQNICDGTFRKNSSQRQFKVINYSRKKVAWLALHTGKTLLLKLKLKFLNDSK